MRQLSVIVSVFVSELLYPSLGVNDHRRCVSAVEGMATRAKVDLDVILSGVELMFCTASTFD